MISYWIPICYSLFGLLLFVQFHINGTTRPSSKVTANLTDSDGNEIYLEAFSGSENDRLLREIQSNPDVVSQLVFFSVGHPKIVLPTRYYAGVERWKISAFEPNSFGFHFNVQMLTKAYREALAFAATTKYQTPTSIEQSQIPMMWPDSFTCEINITSPVGLNVTLLGSVYGLHAIPLKVDVELAQDSPGYQYLSSGNPTSESILITCEFTKRAKRQLYNQLVVTPQHVDQLNLISKLFGEADSVFVSQRQLYLLCKEVVQHLMVIEYESGFWDEGQFESNFINYFFGYLSVHNSFTQRPTIEVLSSLSPYKIDSNLSPNEIMRDLSGILKIETVRGIQVIVENKNSSLMSNVNSTDFGVGLVFAASSSVGNANFLLHRWTNNRTSIDYQLIELNEFSSSAIQFEREGMKVVPKSLLAAEIFRSQMSQPMSFSRIRRKVVSADFYRKFELPLPSTAAEILTTRATTTTMSTTTTSSNTTSDPCTVYQHKSCQTSTDCCGWNTAEFKLVQSCGDSNYCGCIAPGNTCNGGFRCCDGSICNDKCPPVAQFHFCNTFYRPNCQSGLNCTVDSLSTLIWGRESSIYGRCL